MMSCSIESALGSVPKNFRNLVVLDSILVKLSVMRRLAVNEATYMLATSEVLDLSSADFKDSLALASPCTLSARFSTLSSSLLSSSFLALEVFSARRSS